MKNIFKRVINFFKTKDQVAIVGDNCVCVQVKDNLTVIHEEMPKPKKRKPMNDSELINDILKNLTKTTKEAIGNNECIWEMKEEMLGCVPEREYHLITDDLSVKFNDYTISSNWFLVYITYKGSTFKKKVNHWSESYAFMDNVIANANSSCLNAKHELLNKLK